MEFVHLRSEMHLSPVFLIRIYCQNPRDITSVLHAHATGKIKYGYVAKDIWKALYLPEELRHGAVMSFL